MQPPSGINEESTYGVPLATAREISKLFCKDGDWNLEKLKEPEGSGLLSDEPNDTAEERVLYSLGRDLENATAEIELTTKQWKAIVDRVRELQETLTESVNNRELTIPELRAQVSKLDELVAETDPAENVRKVAQSALMAGLRFMVNQTIQDWPKGPGAELKRAMWDVVREVHTGDTNLTVKEVYVRAKDLYEERNPQEPKSFLTWHTVKRFFKQRVLLPLAAQAAS